MRNIAVSLVVFLFATPLLAAEVLPPDVAALIERIQICEHFRHEPWPEGASTEDRERRTLIASQIELHCTGLDEAARTVRE